MALATSILPLLFQRLVEMYSVWYMLHCIHIKPFVKTNAKGMFT